MKHLNGQSLLHLNYHRCELKLNNNVTTSIRFFQDIIHEKKDFASRFCIDIIPEQLFRLFRILSDTQANICLQYR